jgi:hypothetical protein
LNVEPQNVVYIGQSLIYGYRSLDGARGTVLMQITGLDSDDGQRARVQIKIHEGTGDYADLVGSETFEIELTPGASALETTNTFTAQLAQE